MMVNNSDLQRDVGRLEGKLEAAQKEIAQMRQDFSEMRTSIHHIVAVLDQAKGGWRVMVAIGGLASAITAGLMHLASFFWPK